jgi:hypothetical protein
LRRLDDSLASSAALAAPELGADRVPVRRHPRKVQNDMSIAGIAVDVNPVAIDKEVSPCGGHDLSPEGRILRSSYVLGRLVG